MIQDKIKQLHTSDYFGVIAEAGCGVPVASALLNVEGASRTVYASFSPYSKDAQSEMFGYSADRAVSHASVRKDLCALIDKYAKRGVNFVYYSSFQLTHAGEDDKSTHGWMGCAKLNEKDEWDVCCVHTSYHLHNKSRADLVQDIGNECVLFLTKFLFDEGLPAFSGIDNMIRGTIVTDSVGSTYKPVFQTDEDIMEVLQNIGTNTYVCISPGRIVRVEELFRDKPDITLYKGSFRPLTNAHVELVADFYKALNNHTEAIFMISIDTFDKGSQELESVMWRVNLINKMGYTVIVTRNGYFAANADFFRRKFKKKINFLLGSDTMNRVTRVAIEDYSKKHRGMVKGDSEWTLDSDDNFQDCTFWITIRPHIPLNHEDVLGDRAKVIGELPDISATMVRDYRHRGDIDGVRSLIPAAIVDDYLKTPEEV